MFDTDAPFKHHVERDRKNAYCRHLKHIKRWICENIEY
jgi:hypothetical protein